MHEELTGVDAPRSFGHRLVGASSVRQALEGLSAANAAGIVGVADGL